MRTCTMFLILLAAACGSDGDTSPVISVGGTYQTAVTLLNSTCPGQTVEQHPTTVTHSPGSTVVTLTHAGSVYTGTLAADGSFTTSLATQVFDGITYQVGIAGEFTLTALSADVTVNAGRQPPCTFAARWAGPKDGGPNQIP